jgi:hypothetical protein
MSVNNEKPAGYDSDGKPYFKEDNSNADSSLPMPPPVPTTPAPPLTSEITNAPVLEAAVNAPVLEAAVNAPVVVEAADTASTISNLSNEINLNISAFIEPNKPAKIGEIKTNLHSLKFTPEIDLVNPTAALDRLSSGINQTIKATSADPLILDEAYTPPAPKPTYGQRAKNALKGVSGFFTKKNTVAPAPIDNSVRNEMQPGGRRMNTKKNRKRRITISNRKKVRPSRRR